MSLYENQISNRFEAVVAILALIFVIVVMTNRHRTSYIDGAVGCYIDAASENHLKVRITGGGRLISRNFDQPVVAYEDKIGISVAGKKKVIVSDLRDELIETTESATKMRFADGYESISIPDKNYRMIEFHREKC